VPWAASVSVLFDKTLAGQADHIELLCRLDWLPCLLHGHCTDVKQAVSASQNRCIFYHELVSRGTEHLLISRAGASRSGTVMTVTAPVEQELAPYMHDGRLERMLSDAVTVHASLCCAQRTAALFWPLCCSRMRSPCRSSACWNNPRACRAPFKAFQCDHAL